VAIELLGLKMAGFNNQEEVAPLAPVRASRIQYIKLGAGGAWEASSFANGRIEWGIDSDPHDLPAAEDWAALREHYISAGFAPSTASGYVTEARAFYEGATDVLWITFSRGHLWWTFAEPDVHYLGAAGDITGSRYRTAIGGWRNCDIHGVPLSIDRLSTRLTKLASYPRTICLVKEAGLCLRYINGEEDSDAAAVQTASDQLEQSIGTLIKRLNWDDFELLSDLMLSRSGWRRVSSLGGILKDIDLLVEQPLTGQRMAVQVKSAAILLEHDRERMKEARFARIGPGQIEQVGIDAQVVPRRTHVAADDDPYLPFGEGGFGTYAGKCLIAHEGIEAAGQRVVTIVSGLQHDR